MPIKRFADSLYQTGQYADYMQTLANAFNPGTVEGLMCRNTVNVSWDGKIYDCDFNAALDLGSKPLFESAVEGGGFGVFDIGKRVRRSPDWSGADDCAKMISRGLMAELYGRESIASDARQVLDQAVVARLLEVARDIEG